jgi:hypothetical protein
MSWDVLDKVLGEIEDVLAHTVEGTEDQPREQHGPNKGCMVYSQEPLELCEDYR